MSGRSKRMVLGLAAISCLAAWAGGCDAQGTVTVTTASTVTNDPADDTNDDAPVLVTSIDVAGKTTLTIGEETILTVTVSPADASDTTYTLTQSAPSVLSLGADNKIKGLALGKSTIFANANDESGVMGLLEVQVVVDPNDIDGDGVANASDDDADGDGWLDVDNINELYAMRLNPTASAAGLSGVAGTPSGFELTKDLDFNSDADYADVASKATFTSNPGWPPIETFSTSLNGNGHVISNLFIKSGDDNLGFFGWIEWPQAATIENLKFQEAYIDGSGDQVGILAAYIASGSVQDVHVSGEVYGRGSVGGLIGKAGISIERSQADAVVESGIGTEVGGLIGSLFCSGWCVLSDSSSTGAVTGSTKVGGLIGSFQGGRVIGGASSAMVHAVVGGGNGAEAGGLIGYLGTAQVFESYASGNVQAPNADYVGGLIGHTEHSAYVQRCYATGDVSGRNFIGGLIGFAEHSNGTEDVYASGSFSGTFDVGGLIGRLNGNLTRAYAYGVSGSVQAGEGGGLVDLELGGTHTDAYWNTETTGFSASAVGLGKTTAELQSPTDASGIYANWNPGIWDFGTDSEYPALVSTPGGPAAQR